MTPQHGPETFTYRGRSLEELVPRIRSELGDDAVIVARREMTSGGVGGFFAKREIEVEVRPGESVAPHVAAAFAQQLAEAHARQQADVPGALAGGRPATGPAVDALPAATDVTVDDLFPTPPAPQSQGLAALFNAGVVKPPATPEAAREPEVAEVSEPELATVPESDVAQGPEPEVAQEPEPEVATTLEPEAWEEEVEQPTGIFDYLGRDDAEAVELAPKPKAVDPEPEVAEPEVVASVASHDPRTAVTTATLPAAALAAAEQMVARGLRPSLAETVAEEAIASLLPLNPSADPQTLVVDALARRIPVYPLRRGPGVVGFVGPGGAGKTRCVARLAAAHARHGDLPVSVLSLRSPDGGAELTRLLAPYDVALHVVDGGAEGAAAITALRDEGLVIIDTPGVSPRAPGELRALGDELRDLAPDELHLTVSATTGAEAARELVGGVRELGVSAVVVTHTDETEILGTVIGLAVDCHLPLSYLARGQAVDAGLASASPAQLAADLLP